MKDLVNAKHAVVEYFTGTFTSSDGWWIVPLGVLAIAATIGYARRNKIKFW